jgi:hypothetical protein
MPRKPEPPPRRKPVTMATLRRAAPKGEVYESYNDDATQWEVRVYPAPGLGVFMVYTRDRQTARRMCLAALAAMKGGRR